MATCHPSEKTNNIQSTQHKFMQQNYIFFFSGKEKKKEERNRVVGAFSSADTPNLKDKMPPTFTF
jgi:hypothetical protein